MYQQTINLDALIDRIFIIKKEEISPENINFINKMLSYPVLTEKHIIDRCETVKKYQQQLHHLLQIPKIEQRSPEWHQVRSTLITASDFGQAIGCGKFANQKQFYKKKCGFDEQTFDANLPPLKWGVMFEPLATSIYEKRENTKVNEFGLLKHPTIPYFGASPDGITDEGICLEIKCPYKREIIVGQIPEQYNLQVHGQLDVTGLEECDFLECKFYEYFNDEEFFKDYEHMFEKGVIIEYKFKDTETPQYCYGDILTNSFYNEQDYRENENVKNVDYWIKTNVEMIKSNPEIEDIQVHYWKLEIYNILRIYRDRKLLKEKFEELDYVWSKVNDYRNNQELYNSEINSKKPLVPKNQLYAFAEDED